MTGRETRKLLKQCEAAGCVVERTRRHYRVVTPSGQAVIVAGTPSDPRSLKNTIADLRRAGVDFGDRPKRRRG